MSTDLKTTDVSSMNVETSDNKARLYGLVVKLAHEDHVTILSGGIPVVARLPVKKEKDDQSIIPGCWVNFEMDLKTGANQIIGECQPHYRTYFFNDGTFSVVCPAAYYVEDGVDEDDVSIAYTPFFKFVDDPKGVLQGGDWLEWYECVLTASDDSPYLLQVDRIVKHMPGCIEPGSMPGMTPSTEHISAALEQLERETRDDYSGVQRVLSTQLGLCIGHIEYTRVEDRLGNFSGYGSGKGEGRGAFRGSTNHNQRWGQAGGNGGWRGSNGGSSNFNDRASSSNDWRRDRDAFQADRNNDGNWRVGARKERNVQPGMQHQRSGDSRVKKVKAALIYGSLGVMMSRYEHEDFKTGDWLTFDKVKQTDLQVAREKKGRDTYPPYILQHNQLPADHGGKSRKEGAGKLNVQVLVRTEFGSLRKGRWHHPTFFGVIKCCSTKIIHEATKRLTEEKPGWEEMNEKEKDEVLINVWVGLSESQQMMKLPAMDPFPAECAWEVRDLSKSEFIHDLPLDRARIAGAFSNIVL